MSVLVGTNHSTVSLRKQRERTGINPQVKRDAESFHVLHATCSTPAITFHILYALLRSRAIPSFSLSIASLQDLDATRVLKALASLAGDRSIFHNGRYKDPRTIFDQTSADILGANFIGAQQDRSLTVASVIGGMLGLGFDEWTACRAAFDSEAMVKYKLHTRVIPPRYLRKSTIRKGAAYRDGGNDWVASSYSSDSETVFSDTDTLFGDTSPLLEKE